jgi:tetratricopeptide (TPR) repeat protein
MGLNELRPTFDGPAGAGPEALAPESAGPLFPKKAELSTDPRLIHADELLADLASTDAFRITPSLKAAEARPFGRYPGEPQAIPANKLLGEFKGSLDSAHAAILGGNPEASIEGLQSALDAIHGIGAMPLSPASVDIGWIEQGKLGSIDPSSLSASNAIAPESEPEETIAPLHAWLPDGVDQEALSRLTFSYAELTSDRADQRKALHYLDLLIENLPNPLKGDRTSPRQRLLRMFALIYTGRALDKSRTVQEAIRHYEEALEINDIHTPGIEEARLIAYAELINLHFKRAYKLSAERKTERFMRHIDEIVRLRGAIEQKLSHEAHRDALVTLRQDIARSFWHLGMVGKAYEELLGTQTVYASSKGIETFRELVSNSGLPEKIQGKIINKYTKDGTSLRNSNEITPLSPISKAWLWTINAIRNASRGKTWDTVKVWTGGAAIAAGAAYAFSSGDASAGEMLAAAGAGAAITDGAIRFANGASSPRTKEAVDLGLNDIPVTQAFRHAAGFAASALLPYALMGGSIPGLGALDSVPVIGGIIEPSVGSELAAGSIYGPGALVTGAIDTTFGEVTAIADAFRQGGAVDAAASYAGRLGDSHLGSTLVAAYSTYRDAIGSALDGTLFSHIASSAKSAMSSDAANIAFNSYKASALGYYALARLSPKFRENMNWLGPAFVPGGLFLAADMGAALGAFPGYVDIGPLHNVPMNLVGTAAVGAGYQVLGQTLIGNKGLKELQWYNLIGCGLIINGYVGVSNNFNPAVESSTFGQMFAESIGRQIGMLPIIAAHGAMLMVDPRRFAENKVARLLFYDHFGNVSRIALGQLLGAGWSGFVPVLAGVSIGFFFTNSMLGRTFNDLAGSRPAALSFAAMLKNAKGVADEGVMRAMERSLRRLPAAPQLTKMSPETLTLPFRAFYHSIRGRKLAGYMLPEQKTYAMISDLLMGEPGSGGLTGTQVETLISATEKFLGRPEDADVARGLTYVLAASRNGPHGQRIEAFLNNNRDVHARLRIERDVKPLPAERGPKEDRILGILRHPYRVCPEEHISTMEEAHAAAEESMLAQQLGAAGAVGAGMVAANVPLIPYMNTPVF